ncbi:5'/3'-nucleotidase SurE [Luedemannella flava]|uniref:5'-nucleotidase n=1 Tax=Luedemannella flava TaxID=349316 RepID=A0ABP4XWS9_9ACTN
MTRVLVTNDDGIAAPGLRWLARAAADRGLDVTVAAPRHESSGTSAALTAVTVNGRVAFDRTDLDGVPAYAVAASPSYITLLAGLGAFGPVPDVVLSGVNKGANAGHGILHSGTVGAALTAAMNGLRGMAVSLDVISPVVARGAGSGGAVIAALDLVDDETRHWGTAADVAVRLLPWLHTAGAGTMLNVNVPDLAPDQLAGVRQATLAPFGQVQMAVAESGHDYVRVSLEESGARQLPGSDLALLADGYAAVTPVRLLGAADGVTVDLGRAPS